MLAFLESTRGRNVRLRLLLLVHDGGVSLAGTGGGSLRPVAFRNNAVTLKGTNALDGGEDFKGGTEINSTCFREGEVGATGLVSRLDLTQKDGKLTGAHHGYQLNLCPSRISFKEILAQQPILFVTVGFVRPRVATRTATDSKRPSEFAAARSLSCWAKAMGPRWKQASRNSTARGQYKGKS